MASEIETIATQIPTKLSSFESITLLYQDDEIFNFRRKLLLLNSGKILLSQKYEYSCLENIRVVFIFTFVNNLEFYHFK